MTPPSSLQQRRAGAVSAVEPRLDEVERIARIGSYALDIASGRWESSDGLDAIFGIDAAFERSVESWASLIHPDERATMAAYFADEVLGRRRPFDRRYRIVRADTGAERWVHGRGALSLDQSGRPERMLGTITDITEPVLAEQARTSLIEGLRRSERSLAEAQRIAHIGSWEWDLVTDTALRSDELHRIYGVEPGTIDESSEAFLAFVHPDDRAQLRAAERAAIDGGGRYSLEYRGVRPDGSIRIVHDEAEVIRDEDGVPIRMVGTIQDITDQVAAEAERARLVLAVEQAADAIMIQSLEHTITYVNPAFCRLSGHAPDELVGRYAGVLQSVHDDEFWGAIWAIVESGRDWSGTIVNRRKDGTLFEVEAVISGIRDASGAVTDYVQTGRDVTRERALESALAREAREREAIEAALERIDPRGTPEAITAAACAEIVTLAGIDSAWAIALAGDRGRILAEAGMVARVLAAGTTVPDARADYLRERAARGPWTEVWRARPEDGTYGERISLSGLHSAGYAPLRGPGGVIGVIGFGSHDPAHAGQIIERLPALATFGSIVGSLVAPGLEVHDREAGARADILAIIETGAYTPVFQPIVDLATRAVLGYEALTRFADGSPPDEVFAAAARSGLAVELEAATLEAALAASGPLPANVWLNLNVSAEFVLAGEPLVSILRQWGWQVVLELTEHEQVIDYPALRASLERLGPNVRLAVDDAGAGFASLRHILELRPDYVKLDRAIVQEIHRDPARQALVAGLVHFAAMTDSVLVAEGVETAAEARQLRLLGVALGQGFRLGRPVSAERIASAALRRRT